MTWPAFGWAYYIIRVAVLLGASLLCCTLVLIVVAGILSPSPTVAFVARTPEHSDRDIYLLDVHSRLTFNLTRHPASDTAPVWSPDGQYIAFTSDRSGDFEIYVMRSNGRDLRRLTFNLAADEFPSWSPDGAELAFVSDRTRNSEIYVMDLDGVRIRQLTNNNRYDSQPMWSPDGEQIVFVSEEDFNLSLFVMNAHDGLGVRRLTPNEENEYAPAWSPDGRQILYTSVTDIYTIDYALNESRRLLENDYTEWPTWSSDGRKIVFSVWGFSNRRQYQSALYMMDKSGRNIRRLTSDFIQADQPRWRPLS